MKVLKLRKYSQTLGLGLSLEFDNWSRWENYLFWFSWLDGSLFALLILIGSTIYNILTKAKAEIVTGKDNSKHGRSVEIIGDKSSIEEAKMMIFYVVEDKVKQVFHFFGQPPHPPFAENFAKVIHFSFYPFPKSVCQISRHFVPSHPWKFRWRFLNCESTVKL